LFKVKNKKNRESIFDSKTNLHDVTYFHQRLYLERRRAERSKYTFSLIVIDIEPFQILSGDEFHPQKSQIFKGILANIRETDVISFYEPNKIAILLPDTPKEGAKTVVDRLETHLRKSFSEKSPRIKAWTYADDADDKEFSLKPSSIRNKKANFTNFIQQSKPCHFHILPTWDKVNFDGGALSIYDLSFFDLSVLNYSFQRIAKRLMDIVSAIFCLILFAPLMFIIAIGIKLTSRGPILFKQKRIGFMGKPFRMLKFRSMKWNSSDKIHKDYIENLLNNPAGSQKDYVSDYKAQVDQRTTLMGRFLRKTSLDELPQLFNILWGDMSLVGPRPHPIYEVEKYRNWYYRRLTMKPGMTGLSKIHIRCTPENYDEAMRFDLRYVKCWSLWLDIKIILKTIPLLVRKIGAY